MSMSDVMDLVEQCRHVLDDVWRQTDFQPYPQARMIRLMDVIGGALTHSPIAEYNMWLLEPSLYI